MRPPSHGRSSKVSDGLYTGPALLDPPQRTSGRGDRIARAIVWPLLGLLLLVVFGLYVFCGVSRVVGPSMEPNFLTDDRVLFLRRYEVPARGDVVVFHIRDQRGIERDLIKRVVGLPGDTVEIRGDLVLVNGVPEVTRQFIVDPQSPGPYRDPYVVPDQALLVVGDNRPNSFDGRFFGPIPVDDVEGRVVAIFSPLTRARRVP